MKGLLLLLRNKFVRLGSGHYGTVQRGKSNDKTTAILGAPTTGQISASMWA